jgi:hypothetical protein
MSERKDLIPFFEREDGSQDGFPAESYVGGFRQADGKPAVAVNLPAETVERAVLTGARLSVWLALDGHMVLDGEGLSDGVLEAASSPGALGDQTLLSLIAASLDPENLDTEDEPVADLTALRAQLEAALTRVDEVIERLKKQ